MLYATPTDVWKSFMTSLWLSVTLYGIDYDNVSHRVPDLQMIFPNELQFSGITVVLKIPATIADNKTWPLIT